MFDRPRGGRLVRGRVLKVLLDYDGCFDVNSNRDTIASNVLIATYAKFRARDPTECARRGAEEAVRHSRGDSGILRLTQ